jgi:steroid Delta-isomerase
MSSRKGNVKSKTTGKTGKKATAKKAARKATKKSAGKSAAKASAKKASKAKSAKKTVAKKINSTAPPVATTPPHTAAELRAIVSRYIAAYNARDVQSILSLYDPKATMSDPIGLPPAVGHKAIAGLYQMGFDMNVSIAHDGAVRCAGSSVAFPLIASSPASRLEVIDVFDFGKNGKIVQMRAYWGPDNLQGDLAVRQ